MVKGAAADFLRLAYLQRRPQRKMRIDILLLLRRSYLVISAGWAGGSLKFPCSIVLGVVEAQRREEIKKYSIKPALRFAKSRRAVASGHPVRGKRCAP